MVEVKHRLCLNHFAVPLEEQTLGFVDPYNLAAEAEEEFLVSLVTFKASAKMHWLESSLDLPARWWSHKGTTLPLLQEIVNLIKDKRAKKGSDVLMPRNHKSLLPLEVRGKVLWFENNARCVVLALRQGKEVEQLLWFVEELNSDIEALSDPVAKSKRQSKLPEDLEGPVEDTLRNLREHARVQECDLPAFGCCGWSRPPLTSG